MKRHISISVILAAATIALAVAPAQARTVVNLNSRWTFFMTGDPDTDNAATVYLPHTWNSDATAAGKAYHRGTGNYVRDFDVPNAWQDKRIFLRIGGAATVTDVFVNSRHKAAHNGGNSAFVFEITDALRYGQTNGLRIAVNNSPRLDILPTAGRENVYGGIFRSVELIVCEPFSISPAVNGGDGVRITTERLTSDKAEGTVRLEFLSLPDSLANARVRIRFTDAEDRLVAQNSAPIEAANAGNTTLTLPFTITRPHLWQGTADPYLYNVKVTLTCEGSNSTSDTIPATTTAIISATTATVTVASAAGKSFITADSLSIQTGFRTFGIDGENNFLLNGKPIKLHGVIVPRDRMMVGTALTPFQIEEDVALIREMGANAVRVTGGQHSDYFYTLCDAAGLIVWNDSPFTGAAYPTDIDFTGTPQFRENGRQQLAEMIAQLYNHPSVAMWGIFSNISMLGDDPVPYIRELNDLAHRLDPQRLTAASSVRNGDVNSITNIVSFDLSFGWESGMPDGIAPWLEQLRRDFQGLHAGISYSAGASIFHQSERLERPLPLDHHHPEGWQAFFHEEYVRLAVDAPGLWGVFAGNMFDFGDARNTSGDGRGIDDRGLVTFDRKDRKDAYWVYKAVWNTFEPFVHIAGKRLDTRTERRQTIRVYSNQSEVELFAGGRSLGRRKGTHGVFIWDGVDMRVGINRLEARAGSISDKASINF